jgi:3-(3-hydroxy-phenyl)propionate hydroxylase
MTPTPSSFDLTTDVLIVGLGPSGATLANLMGRRGHRVVVIDQASTVYDKPRAITADQEALRIFQEIGLADAIAGEVTPHPGTDFIGLNGQVIKRFYPAPPPNPLAWEPSFMFVQPELEATLRQGLSRWPGVVTLTEHKYLDLQQDADGVTARVQRLTDERELHIRARYVVAADGATSSLRKQLGSPIEDLAFDEWWIVLDAWLRGPVALPERCMQYCRPSRPGTYIKGPGALRRWEIKLLPGETAQDFQTHESVWNVLGDFVDTSHLEHCRTAVYRFHALVVQEWREGRVFLMGDAAHQMPPFLGQGLCAGVRDAYNLAWKLDAVMRGQAPDALLDTYGEERKPHVRTVVAHAKSFGLIIGELDVERARARDQQLEAELNSGQAVTVRQKFIPGLETGLLHRGADGQLAPGAGELCIQPWVRTSPNAEWQRLDDVAGAGFTLITNATHLLSSLSAQDLDTWRRMGGSVVVLGETAPSTTAGVHHVVERDGLMQQWLQTQNAQALVARPDHYVYGVAASAQGLHLMIQELGNQLC